MECCSAIWAGERSANDTNEQTGMLIRDGAGFYLRRDLGGRYTLKLRRVPVDFIEKRVRVIGTLVEDGLVSADGVGPGVVTAETRLPALSAR